MPDELKNKTIQALVWSSFERFGPVGIQFITLIILARLLTPEEFGLIAMIAIFIAIAQTFIDSGFGQALIQKQDATHIDECSIFYFNIFMGLLFAGLLCMAAPYVAAFYNQPLLKLMTYVLSLNIIINAFGLIQTTLLTKNIDFKIQLKISGLSSVLSGIISVTLAFSGFGVWSLVAQSLTLNLSRTFLLWLYNSWRPSFLLSLSSLRDLFSFGARLLLSGIIDTFFQHIYLVVIGKLFSTATLGFYTRAKELQQKPVTLISSAVSRVTFSVFSMIQTDKPRLKRGARKALKLLVMVTFPLMVGLAIVAKPLVIVLFSAKWLPCVPYLQLLCVVGMFYPLGVININVLLAQKRSDLLLRIEVIKKMLIIGAVLVTYRWGIIALIYGQIFISFFAYFINAYYTGKMLNYNVKDQFKDIAPYLILAIIMGVGIYSIKFANISNNLMLLIVQSVSGMLFYIGGCFIFKVSSFIEIIEILNFNYVGGANDDEYYSRDF